MNSILIVAYPEVIAAHQEWLTNQKNYFQALYNQFKTIGVEVSLTEISEIRHQFVSGVLTSSFITDLVVDKLVTKAGAPTFNGIAIKPDMVKNMINIPDVEFIITWLRSNHLVMHASCAKHGFNANALEPEYFEIIADVVTKKANTDATIEVQNSCYTANDKGVQTTNLLLEWKSTVDAFNARLATAKATFRIPQFAIDQTTGRPVVKVIRENEARYPADYVA